MDLEQCKQSLKDDSSRYQIHFAYSVCIIGREEELQRNLSRASYISHSHVGLLILYLGSDYFTGRISTRVPY